LPILWVARHPGQTGREITLEVWISDKACPLMTLFVERQIQIVEVSSAIAVCRDPDDNRVLAATIDSGCSHLVTGDSDLLSLK